MDLNKLKEMIKVIEQSKIDVLNIEEGDFKLYYQKPHVKTIKLPKDQITRTEQKSDNTNGLVDKTQAVEFTVNGSKQVEKNIHYIKSPSIGTFYAKRNPSEKPLVQIGSIIKKNDPVCVLEAMKLMNEITSEVSGKVIEVLADEGQVIEYKQPLFKIDIGDKHA